MVAFYPSPAGATESLLPLDTWDRHRRALSRAGSIAPDVEAILIQRNREVSRCFIVPIDAAYELVGLIRTSWKGFDGGQEAHAKIAGYFESVRERCSRESYGADFMTDLGFAVIGASREPYAASPMLVLAPAHRARAAARRSTRSRCALRFSSKCSAAVMRPRRARCSRSSSATPSRYADTLKPMLWTHVPAMVRPFENATEIELSDSVQLRFRSRRAQVSRLAARTASFRCNLLFSGMVFVEGPRRRNAGVRSVELRGALRACRSRSGAKRSTRSSRTRLGFASTATCSTSCAASRSRRAADLGCRARAPLRARRRREP